MHTGKIIGFIPVRGDSKSIPLKNIKKMNNRPLIYWVLDAAVQCKRIDEVVISTDNDIIEEIVKKYGDSKVKVFRRSSETATDTATTESAMLEYAQKACFEHIVLIQATSPMLQASDLEKGIEAYQGQGVDSVLSVVRQKRFIWRQVEQGAHAVNYDYLHRPRRQEFEGYLVENGAFYITSRDSLLESKCRISGNIEVVEMKEESYVEIDEPSDWIIIEELLKRRNIKKSQKPIKMLLTDSDGVLTDGGMYYSENGDELKKFNTKDGMGLERLRNHNIITGIITGEDRRLVQARGMKLKVDELFMGIKDKMKVVNNLCEKYSIELSEIAYIGDDLNDIEVIKNVGLGVCVQDGIKEVKDVADYITEAKGGEGAVREVCELILKRECDK